MNKADLARLRALAIERALNVRGDFTLTSGAKSENYVDAKALTLHPETIELVADAFLDILKPYDVKAVGGPVQGAIPIVTAIAMRSAQRRPFIPAFFVRDEKKGHGMRKRVEGPVEPGSAVALVDDVITSGQSVIAALRAVEAEGFSVSVVVSLVDRESGGRESIERHCPYQHVFRLSELKDELSHSATKQA